MWCPLSNVSFTNKHYSLVVLSGSDIYWWLSFSDICLIQLGKFTFWSYKISVWEIQKFQLRQKLSVGIQHGTCDVIRTFGKNDKHVLKLRLEVTTNLTERKIQIENSQMFYISWNKCEISKNYLVKLGLETIEINNVYVH